MSPAGSNLDRLQDAGLLNPDDLNDHAKDAIETMSADEVEMLIHLRSKMGAAPKGSELMRPNIIV